MPWPAMLTQESQALSVAVLGAAGMALTLGVTGTGSWNAQMVLGLWCSVLQATASLFRRESKLLSAE
jgi:hypothetical protein